MIAATVLSLALAGSALAAPANVKGSGLAGRLARRGAGIRQSKPVSLVESKNATHEQYSSNWAGAVFDNSAAGSYKTVSGTFTVPTPKAPSGGSSSTEYAASAWVGIDGDTFTNSILQTGVDFYVQNGKASYDAWYEWYPDYAYDFSGISFSAGDTVTVSVVAKTTTTGTATVTNVSTGKTVTKSLSSSAALSEGNAEWIVEDFESGGSLVPFANFGTVTFTNNTPSPAGADTIDIKQNNKVLTQSTISGSSVTIKYVG